MKLVFIIRIEQSNWCQFLEFELHTIFPYYYLWSAHRFFYFRTKALALELLAAICLVNGGHDLIISAFNRFRSVRYTSAFKTSFNFLLLSVGTTIPNICFIS